MVQARATSLPDLSGIKGTALAWLCGIGIAVLTTVLALPYFDHTPTYDEFYTFLAARGWLETGGPNIADGAYPRALAFTLVQALFFELFGESFEVARLPSLLATGLLAVGLYVWVARMAGLMAGVLTGIVFATMPLTVQISQFGRFYALHGLVLFAASLLVYYSSIARERRVAILTAVAALACVALAFHLQETTVIAAAGLGSWVAALVAIKVASSSRTRAFKWRVAAIAAATLVVIAVLAWASGLLAELWASFRTTAVWAERRADSWRHYYRVLDSDLGMLWWLFPIFALTALTQKRREMWFCACFVAVTLILHSVAAQKDPRYIFYVLPFIAAIAGVGLSTGLRSLSTWLAARVEATGYVRVNGRSRGFLVAALAAIVGGFALINNPPTKDMLRMLAGARTVETLDYSWAAVWGAELELLRELAREPGILVTSSGMKAIYYLGDYDFEMNANVAAETDTGLDFGIDPRTGRQAVSSADAVAKLMQCYPAIVFISDASRWSRDSAVPVATSALIEENAELVATRAAAGLVVYRYKRNVDPTSAGCGELRPGRRD